MPRHYLSEIHSGQHPQIGKDAQRAEISNVLKNTSSLNEPALAFSTFGRTWCIMLRCFVFIGVVSHLLYVSRLDGRCLFRFCEGDTDLRNCLWCRRRRRLHGRSSGWGLLKFASNLTILLVFHNQLALRRTCRPRASAINICARASTYVRMYVHAAHVIT